MELTSSNVTEIIHETLHALNEERESNEQITVADNTPLLGGESQLDSLAFVSFVADLEDRLMDNTGDEYVLVGEFGEGESNPFKDIHSLVSHIVTMSPEPS